MQNFPSSHKDIDIKEFGNKFRDFDEFTIFKLIDELSNVGEEKHKESRRFVVAGVTKKIKIFEYFLNHPKKAHFPEMQLMCRNTISNVSWGPDDDNSLASCDYDVGVWDVVHTGFRREDSSGLSIGEPQPKRARVPNPEYPNPPPDAVYDIPLCPLCQDNVNDPIEMKKCCRRLFCRKCIVEDLKLLPLCPSCNAEYSLGEVADLINSFSDSLSEQVDETLSQTLQKNNSNFDVKAYCKQFGDCNVMQLSEMLKELHKALKEKRENREKSSRRTELSSVLYLALDDYHQKTEQKIEKNRRQIELAVRVKQFITDEAGSSRQDSSPSTSAAKRADQPNRRRHEASLTISPSARLTYSRKNANNLVAILQSHGGAVSYVRYINEKEIVSTLSKLGNDKVLSIIIGVGVKI